MTLPDVYDELDVFGRPKSRVGGVPYVNEDDDLTALQNYVLNLKAKEAAIESGARRVQPVKEIVRESGRLPGYIHQYEPAYTVQEQERLRDEQDPVRFMPIVRRGAENVHAIYNEGFDTPRNILAKTIGLEPTFKDRWNNNLVERYQTWPEKMVRSGASLPGDVMSGRVVSGPGLRATDFSDIPGVPNPLGPMIERTQDLAGMAMGGSITGVATEGAARAPKPRGVKDIHNAPADVIGGEAEVRPNKRGGWDIWNSDTNELWITEGKKGMSKADAQWQADMINKAASNKAIRLNADDEVGGAVGASKNALKDLTSGSFGGNVPPSVARNIGRETMPEILARQRASEGYEAAIRDPETKKLYTGMWHEEVLDKIAKDKGVPKDQLPTNLVKGYVNDRGRFLTEEAVERMSQNRSKTAMFRADDEVGAAVAAMHATEGKAPELKVGQANLPAVIPQGRLPAPGTALNPISNRRGFLRGARDLMAAASNANKIVSMAEKLGQTPIPKNPKVPLKEIWKSGEGGFTESDLGWAHDQAYENRSLGKRFHDLNPGFRQIEKNYYDRDYVVPNNGRARYDAAYENFKKTDPKYQKFINNILEEHGERDGGGTQFSHHQLPGATNYREHLMQMPDREAEREALDFAMAKRRTELGAQGKKFADDPEHARLMSKYKDIVDNKFYGDWDEPDIIGHSRVNDRQILGVGKALHIEEIGSQLHEAGAKSGYGVKNNKIKARISDLDKVMNERQKELWSNLKVKNERNLSNAVTNDPVFQKYREEYNSIYDQRNPVPDFPFKKTYVDLAVNRMLHEAATQGYDAVSWTPHELQKKNYGGDSNKEILPRIEALAKKYGGKVEKHKVEVRSTDNPELSIEAVEKLKELGNKWNKLAPGKTRAQIDADPVLQALEREMQTVREQGKQPTTEDVYHVKLTPEMKRIFGHDDFSFFPKPKPETGEAGKGFKLRSDSEAGAAIGALRNSVAPTFYSGLSRTIERAPFETATPSQWMKHLRDTVGARQAEEFEHVGLEGRLGPLAEVKAPVERKAQAALEAWKAANKGQRPPKELTDAASNENKRIVEQRLAEKGKEQPLTKAELLAHVAGNQPKFKEIVKGKSPDELEAAIHSRAQEIMNEENPGIGEAHPRFHDFFDRAVYQAETELQDSTKYSDYQLPGGTNYREHLMTMPIRAENEKRIGTPNSHYSSHWDEPNVIVHTRMNDRDLSGARSLHAEEFQSDLHQEGRKKGYKGNQADLQRRYQEALAEANKHPPHSKAYDEGYAKASKLASELTVSDKVPNFPFKKSWPDLAVKRWLREAADNDYDAVSWTPGEAQRDRFQLAHSIENLTYAKHPNGTYTVEGERRSDGGTVKINRGLPVKENELAQHVGEAIAEKIKNNMGQHHELDNVRTLHNADLKVGGEGLVSFYDKTIKGKVEALVERFGGKVEKHKIKVPHNEGVSGEMIMADLGVPRRRQPDYWRNLSQQERDDLLSKYRSKREGEGFVWSVKLTPEIKAAIRREGFPLFTAGPVMTPVDHDPFDEKQKAKPRLEPVDHDPFAQPTPDLGGALNKLVSSGYRPRPRPVQNGFGRRQ